VVVAGLLNVRRKSLLDKHLSSSACIVLPDCGGVHLISNPSRVDVVLFNHGLKHVSVVG
jgi:hypothetical protein